MSRKRSRRKSAPSYRLHKASNQAIVSIGGKMHYLGEYDSEESHQRYKQTLADHWSPPSGKTRLHAVWTPSGVPINAGFFYARDSDVSGLFCE